VARTGEQVVRDFCAAWSRRDLDELLGYFTADAVYHNMPGPALTGADAIRAGIARFLGGWSSAEFALLHVAASGHVVFTERIDRIRATNGKSVDLPVAGVFEVAGERIAAWRDYFDLATYQRGMS
jgi:limonene-1,2-epoxide hydrolase